jgi:hypothetical protein
MIIDISNDEVIGAESLGFFLGIPQDKTLCTGTIDVSNKVFKVSDAPLYPKTGMGVLPTVDDIIAYSRIITEGVDPLPDTFADTEVTVSKLSEMTDYLGLYDGIELAAVPTGADEIRASFVEMLEPFIAQGVEPKITQKADEINRINSTDTMTAYGNIKIDIKQEQIMSLQTIKYIRKLMFEPYKGIKEAVDGYNAYTLRPRPRKLYGFENIRWDDDLVGRIYFEDVTISPDLPSAKAKGQVGFTLQMNVAKLPQLVLPEDEEVVVTP